jgi:hypothetical protein
VKNFQLKQLLKYLETENLATTFYLIFVVPSKVYQESWVEEQKLVNAKGRDPVLIGAANIPQHVLCIDFTEF